MVSCLVDEHHCFGDTCCIILLIKTDNHLTHFSLIIPSETLQTLERRIVKQRSWEECPEME
jgi:hypothetical protein